MDHATYAPSVWTARYVKEYKDPPEIFLILLISPQTGKHYGGENDDPLQYANNRLEIFIFQINIL